MTRIVVDASVAVAWFAAEAASDRAEEVQSSGADLLAPSLLLAEIGNALLTKARRKTVPQGHAQAVLAELRRSGMLTLFDMDILAVSACIIAERLSHPIYDCLYLALAQREQAELATFDGRMAALATSLAIPLWYPDPTR
ncbi:type II toxin-antitoxin system VapC family toxin [Roseomonas sp. F4]